MHGSMGEQLKETDLARRSALWIFVKDALQDNGRDRVQAARRLASECLNKPEFAIELAKWRGFYDLSLDFVGEVIDDMNGSWLREQHQEEVSEFTAEGGAAKDKLENHASAGLRNKTSTIAKRSGPMMPKRPEKKLSWANSISHMKSVHDQLMELLDPFGVSIEWTPATLRYQATENRKRGDKFIKEAKECFLRSDLCDALAARCSGYDDGVAIKNILSPDSVEDLIHELKEQRRAA